MEHTTTTPPTPATDNVAPIAPATPAPTPPAELAGFLGPDTVGASPRDLAAAIKFVTLAASTDDARAVLTGVQLERSADDDDVITLTATDSYRLHTADVRVGPELAALFAEPALLPAKMLAAVAKIAGHRYCSFLKISRVFAGVAGPATGPVTFSDLEQSVTIAGQYGDYPNWRNLMPTDDKACGMVTGQPFGFNPKYLADVCKGLGFVATDAAPMRVLGSVGGSPLKPSVFAAHRDHVTARALLMPVRLP